MTKTHVCGIINNKHQSGGRKELVETLINHFGTKIGLT